MGDEQPFEVDEGGHGPSGPLPAGRHRPAAADLAAKLRQLFDGIKKNQKELALQVGYSPSNVSRWLSGDRLPPEEFLNKLFEMYAGAQREERPPFGGDELEAKLDSVEVQLKLAHVKALAEAGNSKAAQLQVVMYQLTDAQQHAQQLQANVDLLQREITRLEQANRQLTASNDADELRHQRELAEFDQMIVERNRLDEEVKTLRGRLAQVILERDEALERAQQLGLEAGNLEATLEREDEDRETARQAAARALEEVANKQQDLARLQEQLEIQSSQLTEREEQLRKELADARAEVSRLEEKARREKKKRKALEAGLARPTSAPSPTPRSSISQSTAPSTPRSSTPVGHRSVTAPPPPTSSPSSGSSTMWKGIPSNPEPPSQPAERSRGSAVFDPIKADPSADPDTWTKSSNPSKPNTAPSSFSPKVLLGLMCAAALTLVGEAIGLSIRNAAQTPPLDDQRLGWTIAGLAIVWMLVVFGSDLSNTSIFMPIAVVGVFAAVSYYWGPHLGFYTDWGEVVRQWMSWRL